MTTEPTAALSNDLRESIDVLVRVFKIAEGVSILDDTVRLNPIDVQALAFMARRGTCMPKDLASFLKVSPTTISSVTDRLARRGLITRDRSDENRRSVFLALSEAGRDVISVIQAEQTRHCKHMLQALPPDDREVFVALMRKIATAMD